MHGTCDTRAVDLIDAAINFERMAVRIEKRHRDLHTGMASPVEYDGAAFTPELQRAGGRGRLAWGC